MLALSTTLTSTTCKISALTILMLSFLLASISFAETKKNVDSIQFAANEVNDNPTQITTNATSNVITLPNLFENKYSHYSIRYPADWQYRQPDKATVEFNGKEGTPYYYTTVNIQTIRSKKAGGVYGSLKEFIDVVKQQALQQETEVQFLAEDSFYLNKTENRIGMQGRYLVFTFTYQGQQFQQLQFIFLKNDNQVFYTWAYTAPIDRFKLDYPITQAMFKSWSVY